MQSQLVRRGPPRILARTLLFMALAGLFFEAQARSIPRPLQVTQIAKIRGGSTAVAKKDDLKAYRLQQQLYLQTRSFQLRQALINRGLDALQETEQTVVKAVDWDCALSTEENPMSCLFSFDAEAGSKVIAPINSPLDSASQWVTLSSLNRLRRNDPTKIDPLWHSQYAILRTWFRPDSQYSLYNHLTPTGTLLSMLLDAPIILAGVMIGTMLVALLLTLPVWEKLLTAALTSRVLWLQWPSWGRFVHAALPLKLLLGQMAWKAITVAFANGYNRIRTQLIEWECQIWQDCIPLTIIHQSNEDDIASDAEATRLSDGEDEDADE